MTTYYSHNRPHPNSEEFATPPALPARNSRASIGSNSSGDGAPYRHSPSARGSRKKMANTVRASNRAAILTVGEELRCLLHEELPPVIKDRRFHLRTYQMCFVGYEMVDWLLHKGEVESRREAVAMMQKLLDYGVIHHVCDDHLFKDDKLFYRFRKDDGTFEEAPDAAILAKGQRIYGRFRGDGSNLILDRKYHLTTFKQCFVGKELVDWLISRGEASSRLEAVDIGKQLLDAGVFRHVCDDHHFKDEYLFYRFKNDEKPKSPKVHGPSRKKVGPGPGSDDSGSFGEPAENRTSGSSWGSEELPHTEEAPETDEYIQMQRTPPTPQPSPLLIQQSQDSAQSQQNNADVPVQRPTVEELIDPNGPYVKRSIDVVSDPVGYGFVIRGSRPVYVHAVDPSGPASAAGLSVGEYLYSVNGQPVLNASHTDAARIILMGPSTASLVTFVTKDSFTSQN